MGKTKKVGIAGRFGPRYGSTVRKRWRNIMEKRHDKKIKCPRCLSNNTVDRVSTGIWHCKKCNARFTGGAYSLSTPRGTESFRVAKRKQRELEVIEE